MAVSKVNKGGFKEPNAIKRQDPGDQPIDGKKSPWDYRCPQYDERSSCFVNAGTHYGNGIKQPVGHLGDAKMFVDCLPQGNKMKVMKYGKNEQE